MTNKMDFQSQWDNKIEINSTEDYIAISAEAGVEAVTTNAQLLDRKYSWEYGQWNAEAWMQLTREQRCEQVIGQAYLKFLKNRAAQRQVERTAPVMVTCKCGYSVPKNQVMRSSHGTCCPDCYDMMSD